MTASKDRITPDYTRAVMAAKAELRKALRRLNAEIADYPSPISGCDVQYNHLLSERTKVQNALHELEEEVFIATPRIPTHGARVESR